MTFTNAILAGVTLVRDAIQSEGFVTGVTGWRISRDGNAEFNDVTIRGEVEVGDTPRMLVAERHANPFGVTSPGVYWDAEDADFNASKMGGIAQDNSTDGQAQLAIWPQASTAVGDTDVPYFQLANEKTADSRKALLAAVGATAADSWEFRIEDVFRTAIRGKLHVGNQGATDDLLEHRKNEIQAYLNGTFPFTSETTLKLNPDGGNVTINGATAADILTLGAGAITADELDLNPSNAKEVNYNGVPITRRTGAVDRTTTVSSITTTETVIDTVTAATVIGRKYEVRWDGHYRSTVANDRGAVKIREDSLSGTVLNERNERVDAANSIESANGLAWYTADATETKTFVVTLVRAAGTGTLDAFADSTRHALTTVDEVGT